MKVLKITQEQLSRAKKHFDFNVLNNSVTKGAGNLAGALGEILIMDLYGAEYIGSIHYDLLIKGKKIDVKTKRQKNKPNPEHNVNIFAIHKYQQCDYYCFVSVNYEMTKAWLSGWCSKERFYKEAKFYKKGEQDGLKPFNFTNDCYCLKVGKLD